MQDTCNIQGTYPRDGIDSKAFLICFLKRIPYMLLIGLTGAIIGSGLYLLIAAVNNRTPVYYRETEYYIEFAPGRIEAKDYYNAFTWNDVMKTRLILDKTMEQLGSSYSQESVKEMITADILSDVRYLTITDKAEFDSITQIEDNGTELLQQPLFTWRAAFLGFLIAFLLAFFRFCIHFGLNETFYTREQVRKELGIPVLGLLYRQKNDKMGEQELQTCLTLEPIVNAQTVFADVTEGNYAEYFVKEYSALVEQDADKMPQTAAYPVTTLELYQKMEKAESVILVIPFGVPCLNRARDVLSELQRRNCKIAGAVLAQADNKWVRAYYTGRKQIRS